MTVANSAKVDPAVEITGQTRVILRHCDKFYSLVKISKCQIMFVCNQVPNEGDCSGSMTMLSAAAAALDSARNVEWTRLV